MINSVIIPALIVVIAVISTMLVGGFKSFTNLAFLVPVFVVGIIVFAYGHSYDQLSQSADYDNEKILVGILSGVGGMLIGSLLLHGINLSRNPDALAWITLRPGRKFGCRIIRGR
jgi:hypothetical protein